MRAIPNFISTAGLSEQTRSSLSRLQTRIADAQIELSTGRHADVGRTLGFRMTNAVSLRQEQSRLETFMTLNGALSSRIKVAQDALGGVSGTAASFVTAALGAGGSPIGTAAAKRAAEDSLRHLTSSMNVSYGGEFIFGGINTDTAPMQDYFGTPPATSKQAVDAAFLSHFGFSQTDPAVASITPSAMQTFLDGPFAALFDPTQWTASWSNAASSNMVYSISQQSSAEASANANDQPIRSLAKAFTMVADLGIELLGAGTQQLILTSASALATEAIAGNSNTRAMLGIVEGRLEEADERNSLKRDILRENIGRLESVDAAEVSVRIAMLTTQVEASYSLTARLLQMSLINHL